MTNKTSIAIIEDNVIIRDNVMRFIGLQQDFISAGIYGSVEAFMHTLSVDPTYRTEILLLDIGLPGISGLDGIPGIREKLPETDIIILTTYEEADKIIKALSSGACSYISKKASLQEIVDAIRVVKSGGAFLSPSVARGIVNHFTGSRAGKTEVLTERQREILHLLMDGRSYETIGKELFISVETVRTHIKKMYRVLEVSNKVEAIAKYNRGEV
jgi:DNA-binding NarL/FixJ family response regulator